MGIEKIVLLVLHILGASIWIGGLLIFTLGVIPNAKKQNNGSLITNFEKSFHILGMVALTVQLLTGFRLAMIYLGGMKGLFDFSFHGAYLFVWKLSLILISMGLFVMFKKKALPAVAGGDFGKSSSMLWLLSLLALALMVLGLGFSRGIV